VYAVANDLEVEVILADVCCMLNNCVMWEVSVKHFKPFNVYLFCTVQLQPVVWPALLTGHVGYWHVILQYALW